MPLLTHSDLKELATVRCRHCVSIYMPAHKAGADTRQDPIRFKNLAGEAERRLKAADAAGPALAAFLDWAGEVQHDGHFWKQQDVGLAAFATVTSDGELVRRLHPLPLEFDELVVVNDRMHVKPLLRLFQNDGRFYVLAISQKNVRLLVGTHFSISEARGLEFPTMDEALGKEYERHWQLHSHEGGDGRTVSHGHVEENHKADIREYLHKVDQVVCKHLKGQRAPLVLAGVDYLLPIYRDASSYRHLHDQAVIGSPDRTSAADLHAKAWTLVEPAFTERQSKSLDAWHQARSNGAASDRLREIVPAAHDGRISTLFIERGHRLWGAYFPDIREIEVREENDDGSQDLLDLCAVQTLLHDGDVYLLDTADVPGAGPAAALFRYTA